MAAQATLYGGALSTIPGNGASSVTAGFTGYTPASRVALDVRPTATGALAMNGRHDDPSTYDYYHHNSQQPLPDHQYYLRTPKPQSQPQQQHYPSSQQHQPFRSRSASLSAQQYSGSDDQLARVQQHTQAYTQGAPDRRVDRQNNSASPISSNLHSTASHSSQAQAYHNTGSQHLDPGRASPSTYHTPSPVNSHSRHPTRPASPRSRPTTPSSQSDEQHQRPRQRSRSHSRSRIPTRARAYSTSASSVASDVPDLEVLAGDAPPLPPLPYGAQHSNHHALALAYAPGRSSAAKPALPFPQQSPPTPPSDTDMSVSSHAPEAPHRLGLGTPSGIPVLKSRTRSAQRSPSPDLPTLVGGIGQEPPPFRVDLDAALAELEDELEIRAQERYALARPAPNNPGSLSTPKGRGSISRARSGQSNPSTPGSAQRRATTGGGSIPRPQAGYLKSSTSVSNQSPRTPKNSLGRAATLSSPDREVAAQRARSIPRRRHGSDTTSLGINGHTPRNGARARPAIKNNGSPSTAMSSSPSQRLGVAAHFVPPESNFTPPKGADWDDVVLPTVAKKLGISTSMSTNNIDSGGDEDLAVEWDKDGTPIRWEKARTAPARGPYQYNAREGDDFGPSFQKREGIELTNLRTSAGQATSLERDGREGREGREEHKEGQSQSQSQPQPNPQPPVQQFAPKPAVKGAPQKKQKRERDGDEVKGGCGCVIM